MHGTQARNLQGSPSSATEWLEFEGSAVQLFSKVEEVRSAPDGAYCVPKLYNSAVVNALQQPSSLLQVTLMQESEISADGLAKARRQLREPAQARLYFVVPCRLFEQYRAVSGVDPAIQQWVLKIPEFEEEW